MSKNDKLLVCGSAQCLWDDLKKLGDWKGDVMAVNLSALHLPFHVDHWVSFHHEFFETAVPFLKYLQQRIYKTEPLPTTHSSERGVNVDRVWRFQHHDKSGWFAAKIACELDYRLIVLCGIPMDNQPKFYEDKMRSNYKLKEYLWKDLPREKIRSMSGNTREYFGCPMREEMY